MHHFTLMLLSCRGLINPKGSSTMVNLARLFVGGGVKDKKEIKRKSEDTECQLSRHLWCYWFEWKHTRNGSSF